MGSIVGSAHTDPPPPLLHSPHLDLDHRLLAHTPGHGLLAAGLRCLEDMEVALRVLLRHYSVPYSMKMLIRARDPNEDRPMALHHHAPCGVDEDLQHLDLIALPLSGAPRIEEQILTAGGVTWESKKEMAD
jgi:hypothetical protein